MAPMSQFVQRLANYLANEVFIKGLANSKTFQRFALRTDHTLQNIKKQGTETLETSFEEMTKRAASTAANSSAAPGTAGGPPLPPPRGFAGFLSAFAKEVRRDFGGGK